MLEVEGEESATCPACHHSSDRFGLHAMNCGSGGERICCHNSLRDSVHDLATEAGLRPRKEVCFLLPGRDSRPANFLLSNWAGSRDAALGLTVINPC